MRSIPPLNAAEELDVLMLSKIVICRPQLWRVTPDIEPGRPPC